jgi:hypothetical protein
MLLKGLITKDRILNIKVHELREPTVCLTYIDEYSHSHKCIHCFHLTATATLSLPITMYTNLYITTQQSCAMAQEVSRRLPTAETRVRFQVSIVYVGFVVDNVVL